VTDPYRSLLWYLLVGTRGGPNRTRILEELRSNPQNAHRLAERLSLDYRTVRHHLRVLESAGVVHRPVAASYAAPYELSPHLLSSLELLHEVRAGGRNGPARAHGSPVARPRREVA
jgi:DNA-binding transcriptional ArsR family regulator